jgi:hypothetical protein
MVYDPLLLTVLKIVCSLYIHYLIHDFLIKNRLVMSFLSFYQENQPSDFRILFFFPTLLKPIQVSMGYLIILVWVGLYLLKIENFQEWALNI